MPVLGRSARTTRARHAWRERFHRRLDEVRAQGFDERFIRMWDLYLGYCEAAFAERQIGNVQLLLARSARGGGRISNARVFHDPRKNRAFKI